MVKTDPAGRTLWHAAHQTAWAVLAPDHPLLATTGFHPWICAAGAVSLGLVSASTTSQGNDNSDLIILCRESLFTDSS